MSYRIERDLLVQLVARCCAHTIMEERGDPIQAEHHLAASDKILHYIGVRDITEFNEECGAELGRLGVEEIDVPRDAPDDPYLWESGT